MQITVSNVACVPVVPWVVYVVWFPQEECLWPAVFVSREAAEAMVTRWPMGEVLEQPVLSSTGYAQRPSGGVVSGSRAGERQTVLYMAMGLPYEDRHPEVFLDADAARQRFPNSVPKERGLLDMSEFAPVSFRRYASRHVEDRAAS